MTPEDEEFNRIELESRIRKEAVLQALHNENERLGLYKDAYGLEHKRAWVGLNWDDLPEIYVGDKAFMHGAKWAEAKLKEKNDA